MRKVWLSGLTLVASIALAASANAQVKVGVAGPLTGGYAAFGAQLKRGAEQAVADINEAGGILGQKIELFAVTIRATRSRVCLLPTSSLVTACNS
jgi:general L-amino acid-binding protein